MIKRSRKLATEDSTSSELRIIGGKLRGSRLLYTGSNRTRPMKDRVREALFNLVGPEIEGMLAIDLFAGTGAIGIEALSRGARQAILIERHVPTMKVICDNIAHLGLNERSEILPVNAFHWVKRDLENVATDFAWAVFCSPPYDFYIDREDEMLGMLRRIWQVCPAGSILVVEADARFDFGLLPEPVSWNRRSYPPAEVGVLRTRTGKGESQSHGTAPATA